MPGKRRAFVFLYLCRSAGGRTSCDTRANTGTAFPPSPPIDTNYYGYEYHATSFGNVSGTLRAMAALFISGVPLMLLTTS